MSDPGPESPSLGMVYRTLRELPRGRVARRLTRPVRGLPRRLAHAAGAGPGRVAASPLSLPQRLVPGSTWEPPGRFQFLEIARDLGPDVDWTVAPSRLWGYHLHALDGLRENRPMEARLALLDRWTASNPFASRPGWEPYPLSLRVVNALETLLAAGGDHLAARARGIALQAWWLEANLENDLGANHLLKNALALAWAGRCLAGRAPERWRRGADALLERELADQLLADGFHAELSPGYHAVLVDDLIRLERLLGATGEAGGRFGGRITDARRAAAAALASVLHPDGEIPLFNDAAFGQAPDSAWILKGAAELDGGRSPAPNPAGALTAGLHRLEGVLSASIFDAGEAGFAGQPGHAHADTLSYELSYGRTRVVVDAGVFDYEPTAERSYARSTRGHNTVEIDGADQSEVWGVFRLGRRARPFDVRRVRGDGVEAIEASHDGYRRLAGAPVHRRKLEHVGGDVWRVDDVVTGGGAHRAVSRLRLHPAFTITSRTDEAVEAAAGPVVVRVSTAPPQRIDVEQGRYFPRFGVSQPCSVLRLDAAGSLPLSLGYRVELSTKV